MKQKFLTLPFLLLLAVTLMIASCSKEGPVGATGPAGPAGPTGAAGAAGVPGAAGAPGAPGTANVIYSNWLNVEFEPFDDDTTSWFAEIDAPKLVDSILNKGTMKVYWNLGSDSANSSFVVPLPIFDALLFDGAIVTVNAYFSPQTITLLANYNLSSYTDNGNNYLQFRYVLIPGGTAARGANSGNNTNTVDWNNYKQVKAFLGLKD